MTTYSISLDDVDLALLPHRTNDFLKKEHYQFQVIKQTDAPELASNTYTCHICSLQVPAAFAREHIASVKHRTNANIANVAAQRTRAHIFALPPPSVAQTSTRFCANCTLVVDDDHEKTKEHRVAVMHDNLLCELMKAYVGNDNESEADQNTSKDKKLEKNEDVIPINDNKDPKSLNNSNETKVTQTINEPLKIADKTNDTVTKDFQPIVNSEELNNDKKSEGDISKNKVTNKIYNNTNSVMPTTSAWVKKEVTVNGTSQNTSGTNDNKTIEQKVKHTEPYEKELRKFMDTKNQFQIKEIYHRIHIKINNDTVNVYSDHFHGFHTMYKNGDIECIVCNTIFKKQDIETHKYTVDHMSGVAKIGDDGEYVRKINEVYSHCILCNQKINNINVVKHKQSHHHNLRKSNNIKTNTNTKEAAKEKESSSKSNENTNTAADASTEAYEDIQGELRCLVCDCRVPRDVRNRKDHLKGFRHMNNLKEK